MKHYRSRLVTIIGLVVLTGCTRSAEEPFVLRESISSLPELHQENIRDGLRRMFGTPSRPRLLVMNDEPAEEDADAPSAAATPDETVVAGLIDPDRLVHGAQVYLNRCSGCHGVSGNGQGEAAAYLVPKPRDYRKALYKFTSTPYGDRPARQDLVRTIRRGAKGTSMPAFQWLSQEDLDAVIDYVIYLSLRGRVEEVVTAMAEDEYDEEDPIEAAEFVTALEDEVQRWQAAEGNIIRAVSAEPAYNEESVKLGRTLFIKSSCYSCHGADAQGQTEWLSPEFLAAQAAASEQDRIKINYDDWGYPAPAANITARMLHGGRRPIDIYRRIYTGVTGTVMPAFGQIFAENPDAIWHMVHYVLHIVEGGDPTVGIDVADVQPTPDTEGESST